MINGNAFRISSNLRSRRFKCSGAARLVFINRGNLGLACIVKVENATFLIDFDDWFASVICDYSSSQVTGEGILLDERDVARVLFWQCFLVSYRNMRVN